jgi:membrane protein YdbS with pleckstrin-like domain
LSRATHIVPIRNAQTVVIRQTPFDRRHGVATLRVDTAGQAYTGGGPQIRNVPILEAEMVARTLVHRAAQTRYRW